MRHNKLAFMNIHDMMNSPVNDAETRREDGQPNEASDQNNQRRRHTCNAIKIII